MLHRGWLVLIATLALASSSASPAVAACPAGHHADGNACDWVGTPAFISGTSRYSHGEFIYSDFVHDDAGANVDGLTSNNPDPPQPVTGVHVDPSNPTSPDIGGAADDGDPLPWSGDFGFPLASPPGDYDDTAIPAFPERPRH